MYSRKSHLVLGVLGCLFVFSVNSQTVYKCQSKGAVVYSHEPCLGAQTVDTTPTQGLDKLSGRSRKGADIQRIEQNKVMAEALHPLLGETAAQREVRHRRFKLSAADRSECASIDERLPAQELAVRKTDKFTLAPSEAALFETRKRYRELRC